MIIKYEEVLEIGGDVWEKFCDLKGVSVYAVNEGGGHCEKHLTIEEAKECGIIRGKEI